MALFHQPWDGFLQDELNALLARVPAFDKLYFCVAFVKRSGVTLLQAALNNFVQNAGFVEVVAGIDHRGTSKQGLDLLLQATPNVFIFRDNRQDKTFHTKLYLFVRSGVEAVAFVGSSNLTAGGLYSNYETNVRFDLDLNNPLDVVQYQSLLGVYQQAKSHALLLTSTLLTDLEQRGWLDDENRSFRAVTNTPALPSGGVGSLASPSPFPRIPLPTRPRPRTVQPPSSPTTRRGTRSHRSPAPAVVVPPSVTFASTFIMTLEPGDLSTGDRSADVWIPLEARDMNPAFWEWGTPMYIPRVTPKGHTYMERRVDVLFAFSGQPAFIGQNIRFYDYSGKHDFRFNTPHIRENGSLKDILRIDRVAVGLAYQYEMTIIPTADPAYAALLALCHKVNKNNSDKHYAYL